MRVFGILALLVASVAARGSGPYLPSGWKPDGPSFYLPSEVAKPKENPVKEIVFQESEASGSDSLREYGPPKLELSLELSKQGLPDAVTEQTFAVVELKADQVVEEKEVTESKVVIEDSEAKLSEQYFVQELAPVTTTEALATEGPSTTSDTLFNVENIKIQADVEVATEINNEVTATVIETKTEDVHEVLVEVETEKQEVGDEAVPQNELKIEEQVAVNVEQEQYVKPIQQENENANSNIVATIEERLQVQEIQTQQEVQTVQEIQPVLEIQSVQEMQPVQEVQTIQEIQLVQEIQPIPEIQSVQEIQPVQEVQTVQEIHELQPQPIPEAQTESEAQAVQEVKTVQDEIQKVETEVKRVETEIQKVESQVQTFDLEVKTVKQLVQNIPEVLINIENENKEKQVENLEPVPESKVILETFGSLEQAPEGFLEYGPPGFTEYGPPKDELLKPVSEEISPELQSIESNEARKRRYSPKFRIARKANRN